jgi:S1-C subfamily serine protease
VIGINSQIASEETSSEDSQPGSTGVGFAIPSNTVAQVVKKIESDPTGATSSSQTEQSQATQGEPGGYGTIDPYGYGYHGQQGNYGDAGSGYTLVIPGA